MKPMYPNGKKEWKKIVKNSKVGIYPAITKPSNKKKRGY